MMRRYGHRWYQPREHRGHHQGLLVDGSWPRWNEWSLGCFDSKAPVVGLYLRHEEEGGRREDHWQSWFLIMRSHMRTMKRQNDKFLVGAYECVAIGQPRPCCHHTNLITHDHSVFELCFTIISDPYWIVSEVFCIVICAFQLINDFDLCFLSQTRFNLVLILTMPERAYTHLYKEKLFRKGLTSERSNFNAI
jgi:hypothetical protein